MAQELAEIPQLYMERPAPYAGLVSNTVGCSKKYLPKPIHLVSPHAKIDGYELFANSHMIFGACTEQNAVYHSFILRIECRYGNEISKIAVYSPAEVDFSEMQKWPQLVDCD